MKLSHIYLLGAISVFLVGCATAPAAVIEGSTESVVVITRIDRGIEAAQRALPTAVDSVRQPAHYQHVYVDSLSTAAKSLKTISLADAVANDVLASSEETVRRFDLDSSKLAWVVLDRSGSSPSDIESVGGFGIDKENLSEVNFDLNETVIINPSRLDQLIQKSQKVSGVFYVVGYADESGIEAKNYLLSQDRSTSVSTYLSSHNVHSSRIHTSGAGVSRLYPGLDRNRRASVSFLIEDLQK